MSFAIEVEFVRPTYDASSVFDNAQREWPPHPARLFNALVDAAALGDVDGSDGALRFLERCDPPSVVLSRTDAASERPAFVPTNQHAGKPDEVWKTGYPARIAKGPRTWPRTAHGSRVVFVWEEIISDADRHALDLLTKQVPYLGRATSPVVTRLVDGPTEMADHEHVLVPTDGFGGIEMSVPRPGYLDALRSAYERQAQAHQVPRRWLAYAEPIAAFDGHASAFDRPFVLTIGRPRDPKHIVSISAALRGALERHLNPAPPELNGHPLPGATPLRHQVALVGLTTSVGPHADGLVRGIGVVFPRNVPTGVRDNVLKALGAVNELRLGRLGTIPLSGADPGRLRTLDPNVWTRRSSTWTTTTPMVSNRYLAATDEAGWIEQVTRACEHADLPTPIEIDVSQVPWAAGSLMAGAYERRRPLPKDPVLRAARRSERPKPAMHVRLRFDRPVQGPVMLGNMRYYGLGLCVQLTNGGSDDG